MIGKPHLRIELMDKCEKCGDRGTEQYKLVGGRPAYLCNGCCAKWTVYARASEAYRQYMRGGAHYNYLVGRCRAGDPASLKEWEAHFMKHMDVDDAMFALASEWLAEKVPGKDDEEQRNSG